MMQVSVDHMGDAARTILDKALERGEHIIALSGQLGAGKTTLVSELAKHIGVIEPIISPTFIIYRTYEINWNGFIRFVHIDAYRLDGERDGRSIRLHELFEDTSALVCIEWPEQIGALLPSGVLRVELTYVHEGERCIEIIDKS